MQSTCIHSHVRIYMHRFRRECSHACIHDTIKAHRKIRVPWIRHKQHAHIHIHACKHITRQQQETEESVCMCVSYTTKSQDKEHIDPSHLRLLKQQHVKFCLEGLQSLGQVRMHIKSHTNFFAQRRTCIVFFISTKESQQPCSASMSLNYVSHLRQKRHKTSKFLAVKVRSLSQFRFLEIILCWHGFCIHVCIYVCASTLALACLSAFGVLLACIHADCQ
jgi:hypothetical protein